VKHYSDKELAKILDRKLFHLIGDTADEVGLECYVVGGFVRDLFLQRQSNDIDVVTVGSGIALAEALKNKLGRRAHLSVFRNFGTAQLKFKDIELEFVGARKESYSHESRKPVVEDGTLEDDQNRRDFTVNALAICLNANRFGELVDPFDGLADMEEGILRTPLEPEKTFDDDPLRMMRAVRFACQLNFKIDDETWEAIVKYADRIKIVSGERVKDELNKIMLSPSASYGISQLLECGLLDYILPELTAMNIVEERNGRKHKNNFLHTLQVLDNVVSAQRKAWEEMAQQNDAKQSAAEAGGNQDADASQKVEDRESGENAANIDKTENSGKTGEISEEEHEPWALSREYYVWIRWAALLHDIGKPKSKRWDAQQGWTFYHHEYIGSKMVAGIFRRLTLPLDAKMKYVEKLVQLHMRPQVIADNEVTDSAVRRLVNDAGDDIDDLMMLCDADITSKNIQKRERFHENFRIVREKIKDLKIRDYKRLLQPCIDGNEIMERYGLKPSREVGELKKCLKDAVLDDRVPNEREPLLKLLDEKAKEMNLAKS